MRGLQPRSFTKIAYSEQLFEVSWVEPVNHADVLSYTVYWCKSLNHRDRPYQCQGFLEWVNVMPEQKTMNITLPTPDIYQFAVAANTKALNESLGLLQKFEGWMDRLLEENDDLIARLIQITSQLNFVSQ